MFFTILKKEAKHIFNDKGFLLIAILEPIVFIIMFGSSFAEGDINHLDTIIVDKDKSPLSNYVISATENSEFFDIIEQSESLTDSLKKLNKSQARAVIYIPPDFRENIDNTIAGEIEIYIDSSNFLTYSSLSGAKVEIAKDTLQNITSDILEDLEKEKDKGKQKIDEIKIIIDNVEIKADELEEDLEKLKEDLEDDSINQAEEILDEIKQTTDSQKQLIQESEQTFIELIQAIQFSNFSQKNQILTKISEVQENLNNSNREVRRILHKIESMEIPYINADDMEEKFNNINNDFENIQGKTEDINYEFKKLERKFLSEPIILNEIAIHGEIKYFDYLGAGVLSLIVFFVCIMAPSLNIISEKEKNTLYRISTTPISHLKFFLGKFTLFLIFGFIIMIYTLILSLILYNLRITGSIFAVTTILFLLACSSISLGLFISSKVKTMQQILVLVPLIIIPSFLISHAFFPPDIMEEFMNYVSYATPMTFSNHALNAIMIKGFQLKDLTTDILALLAYAIIPLIFFILNFKNIKY